MYIDFVVLLSLIIVSLTCVFLCYVGYYAYKHISSDQPAAEDELNKSA